MRRHAYLIIVAFMLSTALTGCVITPKKHPVAGTWDITSVSPAGESKQTWTLAEDLSGSLQDVRGGPNVAFKNGSYADGQLTFDISFNIQGTTLNAKFVGSVEGESLKGEFRTDFGNGTVSGTRRAEQ